MKTQVQTKAPKKSNKRATTVVEKSCVVAPKATITGGKTIRKQIAHSAEGYPLLGNCIYWSFSEMKMPTAQFKAMVKGAGFDEKIVQETSKKSAVIAALETLMDGAKLKDRHKVVEDKDMTVWVVVDLIVDAKNKDVSTRTETKVFFYKKDKKVRIESTPEITAKLEDLIKEYESSHTTTQIRSTVLGLLFDECKGVTVRDNGGLYFSPSTYQKQFENLRKLFEKISSIGACSVDVVPVIDTKEAAQAMWKALTAEVNAEIAVLKTDIENLKENPTEKQQELRFNKIRTLNSKVEMYATLFNETSKDLQNSLDGIKNLFLERLSK
jgi:hypothetical protein